MSISADNTFDTAHSIRIIRNGTRRAFVLTLSLLAPAIILADSDRGRCQSGDCYNGRGVYVWSDGGRLESEFQRGAPIGNIQYREPGGAFLNTHLVNGKAQGPSEYRSRTGETYSGVLHKHIRHGNGTITFAGNRGSYQGDFQNNQAHGSGTYTTQDGGIITGRFQANRAHGNIRATMRGVTFDGLTSEGLANGAGEVRLSNGDSIHSQFESGQIAATGRIAFANGAEYQGDMLLGRPHGTGTLRTGQGDVLSGEFRHGLFFGEGQLRFSNGGEYNGQFQQGRFHGQGKLEFPGGDRFEGRFEGGKMQGRGTYTFANGMQYIGQFQDGLFHGQGELKLSAGSYYRGEFQRGRKHGQGELRLSSGLLLKGRFENDRFTGQHE